jgi:hypothetical protein
MPGGDAEDGMLKNVSLASAVSIELAVPAATMIPMQKRMMDAAQEMLPRRCELL